MNDTLKTIFDRKSARAYLDKEIEKEKKDLILRAALAAPTAGNQQFYTILDITDEDLKESLSKSCDNQPMIAKAKMVLIFCVDLRKWYMAFKEAGANPSTPSYGDFVLATEDAMCAAQNAVIAAESLGIGSCYIGDILEHYEYHKAILKLPNYVYPYSMLIFGYPTENHFTGARTERIDLKFSVHENAYHDFTADELRDMFAKKTASKGFDAWMQYFCTHKYDSNFAKEMDRSVGLMLKEFEKE